MQVWRDTQTGLRESWYQDIVNMYLGGNPVDNYRVWGYMNDDSGVAFVGVVDARSLAAWSGQK